MVDLKVAQAQLSAHLITARCEGGEGSSHLVKASLAGRRLAVDAAPNSTITVPVQGVGSATVTLNKQVRNPDGGLTVTAIELDLRLAGKTQAVAISSATCSGGSGHSPGDPGSPTPTPSPTSSTPPPGEAPTPTPVPGGNLPVTG